MGGVDLLIAITDRSRREAFADWFQEQGATLVLTALGKGTATTEILDYLGLEATEKAVLLCVSPRSPRMIRRAARDLWLDVPGNGIIMAIPVSSIGGAATRDYLLHQEAEESMEEKKMTHELVVVIANRGYTDMVMDAARKAGATGGTAVHAKGTGTELARKFFGVSIAEEKELIFILARAEDRKAIMKGVMSGAGMQTEAQALVFSMPVSDLAGLRQLTGEE
jgi:nitrogen regulatory protein PII